jgi:hypothetical protein
MGFNLGNNTITPYLGSTPITGVYQGSNKVWPAFLGLQVQIGGVQIPQATMAGVLTGETFTSYSTGSAGTEFNSSTNYTINADAFFNNPSGSMTSYLDSGSCTSIGNNAFRNAPNIESVSFPNVTSVGTLAFYDNRKLTSINLPRLTSIGTSTFSNCLALVSASFPEVTTFTGDSNFFMGNFTSSLTSLNFPKLTNITNGAFWNCNRVVSASFPTVTTVAANAFALCTSLRFINLSGLSTVGNNLGGSRFNDNVFNNVPISGSIRIPDGYRTSNAGQPDGDLQYLISRGWTVIYT